MSKRSGKDSWANSGFENSSVLKPADVVIVVVLGAVAEADDGLL